MAEKSPRPSKSPAAGGDRMPTNEELLHELRKHGAKPPPREEPPRVSRRTRDFLLLAGVGSAAITALCFKVLNDSELPKILRLVVTGVGVFCGMLAFVFYGVMSRY